ncbi:MAG: geranylgeranyl reductase [uncultured Solirubrobacterales bacterium]|uniref:Geranylgeranyl reductase n=1 Tax=uncultured Solirubrobacterales bacterium TaxID=768556 RepID=A0A6J4SL94_9ACTN|nr:MAG: geranylgeranyl reductase [uncultured Solirubrobacterales bacterium]
MPRRRTKRGAERTPLDGGVDVLVCGASFAGLAVARELAGARRADGEPARVLMLDRYEIGERQTSACAAPTGWLEALGLTGAVRQTFRDVIVHTPHGTSRFRLPWTFSTFDYSTLCNLLDDQNDATFETAKIEGRSGATVHTDRGDVSAPLIVDALGWRRMLAPADTRVQPPDAPLSRGLEVHPGGSRDELEIWIDRSYVREGYSWSFPARDEVRIGVGSFDPRARVKEPTVRLAEDLGAEPVGYQGNWIPHRLRPAAEDGIFFAGDSAGHCFPLTAEGIRTALYFGLACGRELRDVLEGRTTREAALRRYAAFSADHRHPFGSMLRAQRLMPRVPPRLLAAAVRAMGTQRFVDWSFRHYLDVAPPDFVHATPLRVRAKRTPEPLAAAAA